MQENYNSSYVFRRQSPASCHRNCAAEVFLACKKPTTQVVGFLDKAQHLAIENPQANLRFSHQRQALAVVLRLPAWVLFGFKAGSIQCGGGLPQRRWPRGMDSNTVHRPDPKCPKTHRHTTLAEVEMVLTCARQGF